MGCWEKEPFLVWLFFVTVMLEWIMGGGMAAENWEPEKEVILQLRHSGEGVRVSSRQEWAPLRPLQLMLSFS